MNLGGKLDHYPPNTWLEIRMISYSSIQLQANRRVLRCKHFTERKSDPFYVLLNQYCHLNLPSAIFYSSSNVLKIKIIVFIETAPQKQVEFSQ